MAEPLDLETDDIGYDRDGPVAYVTFDRPEKHNALTGEMTTAFRRALLHADDSDEVRAIIVTGAGDEAFCAGGDLEDHMPGIEVGGDDGDAGDEDEESDEGEGGIMFRHDHLTTPIVAAVNGYCVAAGMEFLQATDIRIAAESAEFGLQEPRWGLSPMGGSHVRLPRQIPYCRAMEFLLTGDLFSAEEAADAGLVNRVVPDGEALSAAEDVAAKIVRNSPFAVEKIKETVVRSRYREEEAAFRLETEIAEDVYDHEEAAEGLAAFAEKREPAYAIDWTPSRRDDGEDRDED